MFESVFRVCASDSLDEHAGQRVKAFVKVDFVHKTVSYKISKPL